ncbi:MAG: CbiX/SirB N-terminal domain-containing protein [Oxalobacteraceae bacterium]|jgi:sirohydrochlorin cobaltochelatase|nr:CbiX/SirB N-terminal domain-containing protein [Oxalobacteraceae bacterium]
MNTKQALVLFAHGARDPRWAIPFERLAERARAKRADVNVSLAFLELMEPRLPAVVTQLVQEGHKKISVVPVFLGQGGHVLRDLPPLLDELRATFPDIEIHLSHAVGEDESVQESIADYCLRTIAE